MQAKSDSNYVAATRHRKFVGKNQFLSSCPPILRAISTNNDRSQLTTTRLDDDDIWFSSMTSFGAGGFVSGSGGIAASGAANDFNDAAYDGANVGSATDAGNDDFIAPHHSGNNNNNNNPMMMESSSEDITAIAPHSSVSAILSYNERRRREDGWNDLGLETILRTNTHGGGNSLLMSASSNVVPFSSSDGGGGDTGTTTTSQQQRSSSSNNNDDD